MLSMAEFVRMLREEDLDPVDTLESEAETEAEPEAEPEDVEEEEEEEQGYSSSSTCVDVVPVPVSSEIPSADATPSHRAREDEYASVARCVKIILAKEEQEEVGKGLVGEYGYLVHLF